MRVRTNAKATARQVAKRTRVRFREVMPELPAVEHARRTLLPFTGTRIERAVTHDAHVLGSQAASAFARGVRSRSIEGVVRRGKSLLVHLSGGAGLALHLGMTGSLVIARRSAERSRFARVTLDLGRAGAVHFDDPRKLGRLYAGALADARRVAKHDTLGPDASTIPSARALAARFEGARTTIKAALLDQHRIAGLGNIHAGEALFLARLHPRRKVADLGPRDWSRLHAAITDTLERALADLDRDEPLVYVNAGGENRFLVYGRAGAPCPRCSAPITRHVDGGRSTYLCKRCQPHA
jgi:formamidopyrimidine-DNA glycosylase